jgi:ketosteroid isomerase-like protein
MQETPGKPAPFSLDFPFALIEGFRASYASDIIWTAPRRDVCWAGRDAVVANLLREAAAMQALTFTRVRCSCGEDQVIDEFVARFRYGGAGIEKMELPAGAMVELERVRILAVADGQVIRESAIETWTVLSEP